MNINLETVAHKMSLKEGQNNMALVCKFNFGKGLIFDGFWLGKKSLLCYFS